jgi:DNA polymerase-3 subunit epsilon
MMKQKQTAEQRRAMVAERVRGWLDCCWILDTETTGLDELAEVCEIAVIDQNGRVCLDTLVRPNDPIPADAAAIHGITDHMVNDAPMWLDVAPMLMHILCQRPVVTYNAAFDMRMCDQSNEPWGMGTFGVRGCCAMEAYAEYHGEPGSRPGDYRWQKLGAAAQQLGVPIAQPQHRALGDCLTTLAVLRAMVEGQ